MKHVYRGSIAVVVAAILWSLDGLLRRQLYNLPSSVVVFWEHLLGLIILAPIFFATFKKYKTFTRKQWLSIILVSALSGALGTYFYTSALGHVQYIPYSVVVLLQQLQPIFAILAAAFLLREQIGKRFVFYTVIALVAAYFVSFPDLQVHWQTGKGTAIAALLAVGAAICWGSSTAFSKYTLRDTSFLQTTTARFAFTPIFALILTFILGRSSSLGAITIMQWKNLLAITFSTGMVALAIYYYGLQKILASRSTILELTWPISAVVIGFFVLHEKLSPTQIVGSIVLLGAMYGVVQETKILPTNEL
ncbi:MAG TPA: DMT family transporter [Candidatus Udaeobacter sp.]|nr:DMT family transporter [Candidatus Udaeobacter sp.]